jgi:hypothetical protein
MMRLLALAVLALLFAIRSEAQLMRFHYILPETSPSAKASQPLKKMDSIRKAAPAAVAQTYPRVIQGGSIRFLYRNLAGDRTVAPIYTGQPNVWATIKMDGAVPVVDIWQFNPAADAEIRTNIIRCDTDLKNHRIEIDLARDSVGGASSRVKIPFRAFLVSFNTVPLRLRLASRDSRNPTPATTNLNFAVNVGGVRGNSYFSPRSVNHYGYALSVFMGATTVSLDRGAYLHPGVYDTDRTNLGISGGVSFTLIRNNVGLVAALGIDHCTGPNRGEWLYQDRPWLGIGISTGLGFF